MDNATSTDALTDEAFALIQAYYDADSEPLAEQRKQQMDQWCLRSEQHRNAMAAAAEEWQLLGALADVAERPETTLHTANKQSSGFRLADWLGQCSPVRLSGAFALLLAIATLPFIWPAIHSAPHNNDQTVHQVAETQLDYRNRLQSLHGETLSRTLPDGSTVSLNWDSEVAIEFSAGQRSLTLVRGEAFFEVTHDSNRPFIVKSGDARVRAVGTAFNVRAIEDQVRVAVTEGTVAVTGESRSTTLVNANQKVAVTAGQTGKVQSSANLQATAWQQGSMIFDGQPLAEVLQEIDRYTQYRIDSRFLPNPDAPVSATYFISRTDEAVRSLMQLFNLRADMRDGIDGPRLVLRARLGR